MISSVRRRVSVRRRHPLRPYEPIVAELFSVERLEEHARVARRRAARRPTVRIRPAHRSARRRERAGSCWSPTAPIAEAIREERAITPAAEWLVDNFHIVDEQLREIRDDLPPGYYRQLPKLAEGHLAGYPARPRHRLGLRRAHRQPVRPREPAPLRARLPAGRAADDRRAVGDRHHPAHRPRREPAAAGRADRHRPGCARGGQRARRPAARPATASSTEVDAQLVPRAWPGRRCRRAGLGPARPAAARPGPGGHAGARLARGDSSPSRAPRADEIVRDEHQRQAATNVTVRNVITSMRQISSIDWREFVESVSLVDELCASGSCVRGDGLPHARPIPPRHRGARSRAGRSERDVAQAAVDLAASRRRAADCGAARRRVERAARRRDGRERTEPGYYLISDGRPRARAARSDSASRWSTRLRRAYVAAAAPVYLGSDRVRHRC